VIVILVLWLCLTHRCGCRTRYRRTAVQIGAIKCVAGGHGFPTTAVTATYNLHPSIICACIYFSLRRRSRSSVALPFAGAGASVEGAQGEIRHRKPTDPFLNVMLPPEATMATH
jgi:hypothetical protein